MQLKCLHEGYILASLTTANGDGVGKYRARVAIMVLDGERTRSQRFVDFEDFTDETEANERAIAGGKDWIDLQLRQKQVAFPTDFATLN
jgi:hypothetical protein